MLQIVMGHFLEHPVKNMDPRLKILDQKFQVRNKWLFITGGGRETLKKTNDNMMRRDGGGQEDNMQRIRRQVDMRK